MRAAVDIATLEQELRQLSGGPPEGIWRSPGRVNLIGEHTDYNDGLALPFAIDRSTFVAARRKPGDLLRVTATDVGLSVTADLAQMATWDATQFEPWARYPLGAALALHQEGAELPGADLAIASSVPRGSGLSSSAALTVAVAMTLAELSGFSLDRRRLAIVAQAAESSFAGTPCGILDQLAVLEGLRGHGVLIDFASNEVEAIPLRGGPFVVVDTRRPRDNASGAYAERRLACQEAARQLGLASLRNADIASVEQDLDGELRRRARHVITENARVAQTAQRLQMNEPIGDLLVASHESLRDDFEVSCPELDLAVEVAMTEGAAGARLTGAGFGGCAIAVGAEAQRLTGPLAKAFADAGFTIPEVYEVVPSDGAARFA